MSEPLRVNLPLRLTGPACALGAVLVIVTVSFGSGLGPLYLAGVALLVLGVGGQVVRSLLQRPRTEREPVLITPPVTGRWRGLNSPASKVPSHTHGLAQTFALDITHEPEGSPPARWTRCGRRCAAPRPSPPSAGPCSPPSTAW